MLLFSTLCCTRSMKVSNFLIGVSKKEQLLFLWYAVIIVDMFVMNSEVCLNVDFNKTGLHLVDAF